MSLGFTCCFCSRPLATLRDGVLLSGPGGITAVCVSCYDSSIVKNANRKRIDVTVDVSKVAKPKPASDLSDWKTWRDANKTLGNCACGINISMCDYHKVVVET